MKINAHPIILFSICIFISILFFLSHPLRAQIPPPGYERELQLNEERTKRPIMERDSITLIDTSIVFDPVTYQSETIITRTRYSLKDYCIHYLGIGTPEKLLDGKPHTIIDPKTYENLIIRYNADQRKIDTIPQKHIPD